jgi:UDP-N-acetylmuramyl tripeptide synthase
LGRQAPQHTLIITGTNGKTTTAGVLVSILKASGWHVVCNPLGANMLNGIATGLIRSASLFGNLNHPTKPTAWVLEVDEANVRLLAAEIPIRYALVTNLFRDQLDRFGELDTTAAWIRQGLERCNLAQGQLFLNAADEHVAALASVAYGTHTTGYRVLPLPESAVLPELLALIPTRFEGTKCPIHSDPLTPFKAFGSMKTFQIDSHAGTGFTGHWEDPEDSIAIPLAGTFNVWNAIAAATVAKQWGVTAEAIQQGLHQYQGIFGRADTRTVQGQTVQIFLIKNPMGTQEVLRGVVATQPAVVVLALNDNDADGRDVSWIWDAPFEWLTTLPASSHYVCSGQRAEDMALRLHTIGLQTLTVEPSLQKAMEQALVLNQGSNKPLVVLPTYTALTSLDQQVLPAFSSNP